MTKAFAKTAPRPRSTAGEKAVHAAAKFAATAALMALPALAQAQDAPLSSLSTAFRHDGAGRLVGEIAPDPDGAGPLRHPATRIVYDPNGLVVRSETGELAAWQPTSVSPNSWPGFTILKTERFYYDTLNQLVKVETVGSDGAVSSVTQTNYDKIGRAACTAVRMNRAAFTYLPANACSQGPSGTEGPDRIMRNFYDPAGQLLEVHKGVGTPDVITDASYSYTRNGKVASITDANGNRSELRYDGFDRQSHWFFPSASTPRTVNYNDFEAYSYDANGNRTHLTKRDGSVIEFRYDALNQLERKIMPERTGLSAAHTRDVYYGYDLRGLQTYARFDGWEDWREGITLSYDGFGRKTSETQLFGGVARTLGSIFDNNGNRTHLTHPDGNMFRYEFDALNRPTAIFENATWLMNAAYDNRGTPQTLQRDRVTTSWARDAVGRLASIAHYPTASSANVGLTYTYNPASQLATTARSSNSYAYTGAVNQTLAYTPNGLNQYAAVNAVNYAYDRNGNLTGDGERTYTYDVENRLVSADGGGQSMALRYDPLGRLYETTGSRDGTIRYLNDGDALVAEYNTSGAQLARYLHGTDAGADDPLIWYEGTYVGAAYRRHLLSDHQGSIIGVMDGNGNPYGYNRYDEWGTPQAGWKGRFLYTGQAWLPELGMYHYKARVYSPRLGRFLQTDPIGYEDGLNIYAYVSNDPLNKVDFDGREAGCITLNRPCVDESLSWGDIKNRVLNAIDAVAIGADLLLGGPTGESAPVLATTQMLRRGLREGAEQSVRVPGRVQSRINISNKGISDALRKHADGRPNKSQFSIGEKEIRSILGSKGVINSPARPLANGNYVREITLRGRTVGNLPRNRGGAPTSQMTIITDRTGNLVNTFPGPLRF